MAQTVSEIKATITTQFMANATLADAYGYTVGDSFESTFSKVSFESICFYIVAFAMWLVQKQVDTDKAEIVALIDTKKPHRLKWYRDKALEFRFGRILPIDGDEYDLTNIDPQSITGELVVKYASAFEYQGKLYIKVAGGSATAKSPLTKGLQDESSNQLTPLTDYLEDIKDAGVRIVVVNEPADHFYVQMDIYYDPLVLYGDGMKLSDGSFPVKSAIKDFVQNQIPFNGEYRNSSLVDYLQQVEGVVIPEIIVAKHCSHANFLLTGNIAFQTISAKAIPASGYYKIYDDTKLTGDLLITYKAYQTIESV